MKLYTKNKSFSRWDHCSRKKMSNEKELDTGSIPLTSEMSAISVLSIPFLLPRYKIDKGQLYYMLTKR